MKQITDLRNQLAGKELSIQEQRAKIESQLRDELFSQKGDYTKRIAALESEKMQTDITIKEYRHKAEDAEKKADEIKAKMEELMAKYDGLMVEHQKCGDIIKQKDGSISDLSDFKSKNLNVALNLKGLQKLFETEPQFKAFNIVAKVGEVSVDEIRTALGVPSVTTNKFVQAMVNAGVFEISPNGKITLKNKLPGF
jgi:chromosome segregation ATPase